MEFPAPVIRVAVEPKTRQDQDKLGLALNRLAQEDPSFNVSTDQETGQTIIAGMGELHLEIIVDRMKREFGVEANVGKPQVAYRETITQPAPGKEIYKKQTGGRGQFGHVEIEVEPAPGEGFVFENKITGGAIPKEYIPAVIDGIEEAIKSGVYAGYQVIDIKVDVVDGVGDSHQFMLPQKLFRKDLGQLIRVLINDRANNAPQLRLVQPLGGRIHRQHSAANGILIRGQQTNSRLNHLPTLLIEPWRAA